jgi:hypothetical protein
LPRTSGGGFTWQGRSLPVRLAEHARNCARPWRDLSRRQSKVRFDGASARLVGGHGGAAPAVASMLDGASVALAAEQAGAAARLMQMCVDYAKLRHQFGRPIGAFQAIKHKLADMALDVERMDSVVWYAATAVAGDSPELPVVASVAKVFCSEAFFRVAAETIQVHGGIGFTWEHPAHLYFRRAKSSEYLLGSPVQHREILLRSSARDPAAGHAGEYAMGWLHATHRRGLTIWRALRRRVGTDEAGLVGDDDELGAVAGVQFHHGALDVGADGQRAEEELPADLGVGVSLGGQRHHLALAIGEPGEDTGASGIAVSAWFGGGQEAGDERAGGLGGQQGVAGGDGSDAGQQAVGADVFAEEAAGAGAQRASDVLVGFEGGQDEDAGGGQVRVVADGGGGGQAVGAGHPDVHHDHVWAVCPGDGDGLAAVGGFADHMHAGAGVDEDPEGLP